MCFPPLPRELYLSKGDDRKEDGDWETPTHRNPLLPGEEVAHNKVRDSSVDGENPTSKLRAWSTSECAINFLWMTVGKSRVIPWLVVN